MKPYSFYSLGRQGIEGMPSMGRALLLVDLLGLRSRWHAAGRAGAEIAFRHWNSLVSTCLEHGPGNVVRTGLVETDAVALLFDKPSDAIDCGARLFRSAFVSRVQESGERFWLRGVITDAGNLTTIRTMSLLESTAGPVETGSYSPEVLDAIAAEKSGFKGMRLLVETSLLTPETKRATSLKIGDHFTARSRVLSLSTYPIPLVGRFCDVLWMATSDEAEWGALKALIARRVAHSARNTDEFIHAAATDVVFHECGAFFGKVRRKAGLETPNYGASLREVLGFGRRRPNKRLHPTAR